MQPAAAQGSRKHICSRAGRFEHCGRAHSEGSRGPRCPQGTPRWCMLVEGPGTIMGVAGVQALANWFGVRGAEKQGILSPPPALFLRKDLSPRHLPNHWQFTAAPCETPPSWKRGPSEAWLPEGQDCRRRVGMAGLALAAPQAGGTRLRSGCGEGSLPPQINSTLPRKLPVTPGMPPRALGGASPL